ncbi:MAG TPA: hypothetical protein VE135_13720 [Pyrinomonadaceae bacterium]|nr:hypothetical protein [Pyrinomonadaceae bacterium]
MASRASRLALAETRLRNILRKHVVASGRTLEQKISDAGPNNQRIDPHVLTIVRRSLIQRGVIEHIQTGNTRWYYLSGTDPSTLANRLSELDSLHERTQKRDFIIRLGQTLEIATFRVLSSQSNLEFFGDFPDLDTHDDSTHYSKTEPPSSLSGQRIPHGKQLDFIVRHPQEGYAGLECKNIREWMYPDRVEIRETLLKCCALDIVPVLIARRIHYSTFSVLNPCGVILHQTFNQLYPGTDLELANKVKDKTLLGYHDVRTGNQPDARLVQFLETNLPLVLPTARKSFDAFKDLLCGYGNSEHSYKSFAARVKRRLRGKPEELPEWESELDDNDIDWFDYEE